VKPSAAWRGDRCLYRGQWRGHVYRDGDSWAYELEGPKVRLTDGGFASMEAAQVACDAAHREAVR